MKKRILSLLLVVLMMVLIIPISTSAEGITSWSDLQAAINAAPNAGEITLTQSLYAGSGVPSLKISGKQITINLNGYTLGRTLDAPDDDGNVLTVENSGKLILFDGSAKQTGTITGGNHHYFGGNIIVDDSDLLFFSGSITNGTAKWGGGIYALNGANVTINSSALLMFNEWSNVPAKIEISGNTATDQGQYSGGGAIMATSGSTITIGGNNTKISDNNAVVNGGAIYANNISLNIASNIKFDNNKAKNGGAICITNGTANLGGATISNCEAENGGAVYITETGRLEMSGAKIEKCKSTKNGGGIFVEKYPDESGLTGVVTMFNGATIDSCEAANLGGGIYAEGNIALENATISNSKATNGGGAYLSSTSTLFAGSTAKITGNTNSNGDDNNVYLIDGGFIGIGTGSDVKVPADGMSIGITMETPGIFTTDNENAKANDTIKEYFTSDNTDYYVNLTSTDRLELKQYHTVTFNTDGGSAIDAQKVEDGGVVIQPTAPTKDGYTFVVWLDKDGNAYNFDTAVTEDITLKASWSKKADPTPTPDPDPEPTPAPEPVNYKIIEGADSTWIVKPGTSPKFRANGDFDKFAAAYVDGKLLTGNDARFYSGSTIVELTPEFTAKLAAGKHTLRVEYTDGYAETVFYIEKDEIAQTDGFDLSEATMSSAFVGFGIVGLSAVFYVGKKKKVR